MVLYFSTDRKFEYLFAKSEEGIHFVDNLQLLYNIKGKLRNKKFDYSINLDPTNPLIIDGDILLWNSRNIAELLLCKLNNTCYPSAFVDTTDITPDCIHCKLNIEDKPILEYFLKLDPDEIAFHLMMVYLKSLGYNCISYLVYEGNKTTDRAYLFDPDDSSTVYIVEEVV